MWRYWCKICSYVVTTETFRSSNTRWQFFIKPNNLNCCSNNVVYPFPCQTCLRQYTGSSERFNLDLTITNQCVGVSWKGIQSNKSHFTVTLRTISTMIWVTGKLPSLMKQIIHRILWEESLFGSMNSTTFNQMDIMSVMWHSFDEFFKLALSF